MVKRIGSILGVLSLVVTLGVVPTWADSTHIGGTDVITVEGGAGGNANANAGATAISGSTSTSSAGVINSNTNVGVNEQSQSVHNSNRQQQGQIQGQQQGQGQGQKQSVNNKQTIAPSQTVTTDVPANAPAIFAPNLTSSPEACMGSVSAGGGAGFGGTSFGITFGTTWTNDQCQDRMNARTLGSLGQNQAALEYLAATNPKIADALKRAGVKLASLEVASVDITVPALALQTPLGQAAPVAAPKIEKHDETTPAVPFCGDGKPAKLRANGFYSCWGYDR